MGQIKVKVVALSDVRKMVGWGFKEVEFSGGTVGELLKSISTIDGESLYDRLVVSGDYINKFSIIVNDCMRIGCEDGLDKRLEPGDKVTAMEARVSGG